MLTATVIKDTYSVNWLVICEGFVIYSTSNKQAAEEYAKELNEINVDNLEFAEEDE